MSPSLLLHFIQDSIRLGVNIIAIIPPHFAAAGKSISPCQGCLKRSYFDHDAKKYGISGAFGNGSGNDTFDLGSDQRRIRRCARFDSCDETVDVFRLRLRWPECCGFPVRLSQSAVLNLAEPSAPIRQGGMGETVGRMAFRGAIVCLVEPVGEVFAQHWARHV